ncbi:MAG: hypothetical protein M5U28_21925 [Sandaracinaceae bacterium]|nr:hypothetical protein [Sandaracinaceae bacterium]
MPPHLPAALAELDHALSGDVAGAEERMTTAVLLGFAGGDPRAQIERWRTLRHYVARFSGDGMAVAAALLSWLALEPAEILDDLRLASAELSKHGLSGGGAETMTLAVKLLVSIAALAAGREGDHEEGAGARAGGGADPRAPRPARRPRDAAALGGGDGVPPHGARRGRGVGAHLPSDALRLRLRWQRPPPHRVGLSALRGSEGGAGAERVFPEGVRLRQWVLWPPFDVRWRAAFDHELARRPAAGALPASTRHRSRSRRRKRRQRRNRQARREKAKGESPSELDACELVG